MLTSSFESPCINCLNIHNCLILYVPWFLIHSGGREGEKNILFFWYCSTQIFLAHPPNPFQRLEKRLLRAGIEVSSLAFCNIRFTFAKIGTWLLGMLWCCFYGYVSPYIFTVSAMTETICDYANDNWESNVRPHLQTCLYVYLFVVFPNLFIWVWIVRLGLGVSWIRV